MLSVRASARKAWGSRSVIMTRTPRARCRVTNRPPMMATIRADGDPPGELGRRLAQGGLEQCAGAIGLAARSDGPTSAGT